MPFTVTPCAVLQVSNLKLGLFLIEMLMGTHSLIEPVRLIKENLLLAIHGIKFASPTSTGAKLVLPMNANNGPTQAVQAETPNANL